MNEEAATTDKRGALDFGLEEKTVGGLSQFEGAAFVETETVPQRFGENHPASFVHSQRHTT